MASSKRPAPTHNLGKSVAKGTMKGPARKEVWRPIFLDTLRKTGNILASCRAANVSRTAAYRAKKNNEEFSAQWDEAVADALDLLEARGFKLAMDGDGHMIRFLLAAHRPDTYAGSNLKRGNGQGQEGQQQGGAKVVIYIPDNGRDYVDSPKLQGRPPGIGEDAPPVVARPAGEVPEPEEGVIGEAEEAWDDGEEGENA